MGGLARGGQVLGVVSDTHGLVRPEALRALRGVDRILHAGDVGAPEVLEALAQLAPVTAVRGNVDRGAWADALPEQVTLEIDGVRLHLLHDLARLDPALRGVDAVITGHSHQARMERRGGVLYFNPGSAGPRRFRLPVSLGRLHVGPGGLRGRLIELAV